MYFSYGILSIEVFIVYVGAIYILNSKCLKWRIPLRQYNQNCNCYARCCVMVLLNSIDDENVYSEIVNAKYMCVFVK